MRLCLRGPDRPQRLLLRNGWSEEDSMHGLSLKGLGFVRYVMQAMVAYRTNWRGHLYITRSRF
jgi:hypothetical protein